MSAKSVWFLLAEMVTGLKAIASELDSSDSTACPLPDIKIYKAQSETRPNKRTRELKDFMDQPHRLDEKIIKPKHQYFSSVNATLEGFGCLKWAKRCLGNWGAHELENRPRPKAWCGPGAAQVQLNRNKRWEQRGATPAQTKRTRPATDKADSGQAFGETGGPVAGVCYSPLLRIEVRQLLSQCYSLNPHSP